jgi:hypothetical protein
LPELAQRGGIRVQAGGQAGQGGGTVSEYQQGGIVSGHVAGAGMLLPNHQFSVWISAPESTKWGVCIRKLSAGS